MWIDELLEEQGGGAGGGGEDASLLSLLPKEFQVIQESSVPLLQCDDGGIKGDKDFIIIAEFSELEGPIPLSTIPPDKDKSGGWEDLSLNNFVVHLMSTDYQVNSVGQFKISEDTQVLRKNVFKQVHVFMQYFTLYDVKARGFVRPFCFGYVSKDHVKLDKKLDKFVQRFDKITRILKYTNRLWFATELERYLQRIEDAKNTFVIKEEEVQNEDKEQEGNDGITLHQIEHQFTEIESILTTVRSVPEDHAVCLELANLKEQMRADSSFIEFLEALGIFLDQGKCPEIDIPLVFPLKAKGEPLRPLTVLGQLGTIYLIGSLFTLYEKHEKDSIFLEMDELAQSFRLHLHQEVEGMEAIQAIEDARDRLDLMKLNFDMLKTVMERVHFNCPKTPGSPSKSLSSYYTATASEPDEEADMQSATGTSLPATDNESSVYSHSSNSQGQSSSSSPSCGDPGASQVGVDPSSPLIETPNSEETIPRQPWWFYGSDGIKKRSPGYWILKFFRHYAKTAHHVFYSLLLGRPLVVCGNETQLRKVSRILTALIPLIPSTQSEWKLLRWHRGVLVEKHIKDYKLIGLCIPERLLVHDLINPRDQNYVTIFNVSERRSTLLGPAYSGKLLSPFESETLIQVCFNSDLSFLMYLGTILTEIETQLYMLKSLQEKERKKKKFNFKEIHFKDSDLAILRSLAHQVTNPEQVQELFSSGMTTTA